MSDARIRTAVTGPSRTRKDWADQAATLVVWGVAITVSGIFLWIVGDLVRQGLPHLSLEFLLAAPRDAGRAGGIGPILVSTLLLLGVCLAVVLPIGLGTAVFLAEFTGGSGMLARVVRRSLDVLAGVPSILFGLFGNAFFTLYLGLGFSILSGGLTLACMVLPLFIRVAEAGIRGVPDDYRKAGTALAISRFAMLRQVILPAASPALVVGVVLGTGRALAETAALLFTSGYVSRMPGSLLDPGRALTVHIYDLAMNVPGGEGPAYATGVVLVALLLTINLATFRIGERWLQRRITPE